MGARLVRQAPGSSGSGPRAKALRANIVGPRQQDQSHSVLGPRRQPKAGGLKSYGPTPKCQVLGARSRCPCPRSSGFNPRDKARSAMSQGQDSRAKAVRRGPRFKAVGPKKDAKIFKPIFSGRGTRYQLLGPWFWSCDKGRRSWAHGLGGPKLSCQGSMVFGLRPSGQSVGGSSPMATATGSRRWCVLGQYARPKSWAQVVKGCRSWGQGLGGPNYLAKAPWPSGSGPWAKALGAQVAWPQQQDQGQDARPKPWAEVVGPNPKAKVPESMSKVQGPSTVIPGA